MKDHDERALELIEGRADGGKRRYRIRTTNEADFITADEQFQIFPEKIKIASCRYWRGKFSEKTHKIGICELLKLFLFINAEVPEQNAFNWFKKANKTCSIYSLADEALPALFIPIFDDRKTYIPSFKNVKRVALKDGLLLKGDERKQLCTKALSDHQTKLQITKIMSWLKSAPEGKKHNRSFAAKQLKISRETLYKYIRKCPALAEYFKKNSESTILQRFVLLEVVPVHPKMKIAC